MYNCPVLLIGFNRYETIMKVFEVIRKIKPHKFYFAVDGPRKDKNEEEAVQKVKSLVDNIDWDCELHTFFRTENRGCGFGPAEAISWAFQTEERLIVLEDDCVPSLSFFSFCDEMLELYKNDSRITIVSGRSHNSETSFFLEQDYIFTHYAHTWGWATWKRAWKEFDIYIKDFNEWIKTGGAYNFISSNEQAKFFNNSIKRIYNSIEDEVIHSWDLQWYYSRNKYGGLGIVPCKNLIHNIGEFGTHSFGHSSSNDLFAENMPINLRHPKFIIAK